MDWYSVTSGISRGLTEFIAIGGWVVAYYLLTDWLARCIATAKNWNLGLVFVCVFFGLYVIIEIGHLWLRYVSNLIW